MIEKELKVILDKEKYEILKNQFVWNEVRTQTNFYYSDNRCYIKREGITIRVREYNSKVALQIKIPVSEHGAIHTKNEYEIILETIPQDIDGVFLSELCSLPLPDVSMVGFLITERYISNWNSTTEVSLDKNSYLNDEDYEIEIEYSDKLEPALLDILNKNNIEIKSKVEGKCSRFFKKLEK